MNNHTGTKAKIKNRILCKKCFKVFKNTLNKINIYCPYCNSIIDTRDRSGYYKEWCKKNPKKAELRFKKMKDYDRKYKKERGKQCRDRVKKVVFNLISNNQPVCFNCGCEDTRLLEINHIRGGGNKELQEGKKTNVFMWNIYMGRRKTDDLNLLCRVCNSLHYLELKYGKLPFTIQWGNNK